MVLVYFWSPLGDLSFVLLACHLHQAEQAAKRDNFVRSDNFILPLSILFYYSSAGSIGSLILCLMIIFNIIRHGTA